MKRFTALPVLLLSVAVSLAAPAMTERDAQMAAVRKYPALVVADSPMNRRFLEIIAEKRTSEPGFFAKPDWPLRAAGAADAALRAEEEKTKAAEQARLAAMTPDERIWEGDKSRWVFERLVFGDGEETIVKKLNGSKIITSRVSPSMRVSLGSRFQWVIGESKFHLDFEMKDDHLVAFLFDCSPEKASNLDGFVHDDWQRLRAAAVERFGEPAKSVDFPDNARKLQQSGWTVTDTWERPGYRIKLGITEEGDRCSAAMRINAP